MDGVSLALWPKEELGPYVGYLPQDVELFDGTLGENIERFALHDPEKLEKAVATAGLNDLISSLPNGLETELGSDGYCLSGGQRQRVGLARALYGDPQLIVLDEPNANLDKAGDAALRQALVAVKARGATLVLVTHRREILEVADLVLVLADGKQRLFGPRNQVFAQIQAARERHLESVQAKSKAA
jgi:ABC-type protease/lipase transport system fused ATPase/permease subunit